MKSGPPKNLSKSTPVPHGKSGSGGKEKQGRSMPETPQNKTVTCMHCRYEYAAAATHCTICGYPWPWLKS